MLSKQMLHQVKWWQQLFRTSGNAREIHQLGFCLVLMKEQRKGYKLYPFFFSSAFWFVLMFLCVEQLATMPFVYSKLYIFSQLLWYLNYESPLGFSIFWLKPLYFCRNYEGSCIFAFFPLPPLNFCWFAWQWFTHEHFFKHQPLISLLPVNELTWDWLLLVAWIAFFYQKRTKYFVFPKQTCWLIFKLFTYF